MSHLTYSPELERLKIACQKRDQLLEQGDLSVPQSAGYVAVLYSTSASSESYTSDIEDEITQIGYFSQEADHFVDTYAAYGRKVEKVTGAKFADAEALIKDERCTDIVGIGNGSYNTIRLDDNNLSWWNISLATTHLKRGFFFQRTCGHFKDNGINVSLPTFLMQDQNLIWAAVGMFVDYKDPNEADFVQVYSRSNNGLADLQLLNSKVYKAK